MEVACANERKCAQAMYAALTLDVEKRSEYGTESLRVGYTGKIDGIWEGASIASGVMNRYRLQAPTLTSSCS